MDNIQIITGWGADHACAAASVLGALSGAGLTPTSARRFTGTLEVLAKQADQTTRLLILGMPMKADLRKNRKLLNKFHQAGCKSILITRYEPDTEVRKELDGLVEFIFGTDITLTALTCKTLGLKHPQTSLLQSIAASNSVHKLTEAPLQRLQLLEAAAWQHRLYREDHSYAQAINTLAFNHPLSDDQQHLLEHYDRFKHLELRGSSPAMSELWDMIKTVGADGDCSVLIGGETGTGKEVVASLMHLSSPRVKQRFEAINCACLSAELLRSELFGHEKGAFTGAMAKHEGVFARTDGGTVFLDEIGDMPLDIQAHLLRVLQEKRFTPLGSTEEKHVDIRILGATNRDLWAMVHQGTFRMDLYFRLNTIYLHLPPLRDRKEDIREIANSYLYQRGLPVLTGGQMQQLHAYDWPGNIRQLLNVLDRARILRQNDYTALLAHEPDPIQLSSDTSSDLMTDALHSHAVRVFQKYGANKTRAAKAMGISINTLIKYLKSPS